MTNLLISTLAFRRPVLDDAASVLELLIRRDVKEMGQPNSSLEDLQYDWNHMNLERDAWLAVAPEGELAGYAAVVPWQAALRYHVCVDPSWHRAGQELGQDLLARCQARGAELARDEACQPLARMYIAHVNAAERAMAEAAGFRRVQYLFQMQIQMQAPPRPPAWPAGVKVRTVVPGQDDRAIHTLIEAAFDRPDRTPRPFEAWQESMMQPGLFQAELWFLAEADGELAGVCLCFAYPEMGWVEQLGVVKGQRQRGLGMALLRHSFAEFWKREVGVVGLAAQAKNELAVGLYEAAGMKRILQQDEYQQSILPAIRGAGSRENNPA